MTDVLEPQIRNRRVCFVLHSHLPWLLQHGTWPVGEEWLYQAYAHSYLPLFSALKELSDRGLNNIATMGITPVLAAQLDNPYTLNNLELWLRNWQLRATEIPRSHPARNETLDLAHRTIGEFSDSFSRGISPVVRSLIDSGAVEVLGGPLAHPFTPNLHQDVHRYLLSHGLADARRRWGYQPTGIWVPECAYRPGQESVYAELGVEYFPIDEPAITDAGGIPNTPYLLGGGQVQVIARDIQVSDHIWSAERGYPGRSEYRDFHDVNVELGLHLSRVGNRSQFPKDPYIPEDAHAAVLRDAREFVSSISHSFDQQGQGSASGDQVIVIGIDTELLGHWWHEGIRWFTRVIDLLPEHGIQTTTLRELTRGTPLREIQPIQLGEGSWGAGKDWRLWTGDAVRDITVMNHQAQQLVIDAIDHGGLNNSQQSELLNELSNLLSSDWAFMVSRDSAADYGRSRATEHFRRIHSILSSVTTSSSSPSSLVERMQPFYLTGQLMNERFL